MVGAIGMMEVKCKHGFTVFARADKFELIYDSDSNTVRLCLGDAVYFPLESYERLKKRVWKAVNDADNRG